jgi:DNA-binding SARP family transcriptional activator
MLRLRTLGGLWLESDQRPLCGGPSRPRSLALLVLVANAADAGITRDKLLGYLWPDSDTARARNCLKQVLFTLCHELRVELFTTTKPVIRLNPRAVAADNREFVDALDRRALAEAVVLYQGPFLDGFYISGLPEFEQWVEAERGRLAWQYQDALEALAAGAAAAGDTHAAAMWWRRVVDHDPLGSRSALAFMQALVADGDRADALKYARLHEALLRAELGVGPDTGERIFVQQLSQLASRQGDPRLLGPLRRTGRTKRGPAV